LFIFCTFHNFICLFYSAYFIFIFISSFGAQDVINRLYTGLEVTPAEGYNLAIQFNCDALTNPTTFLNDISDIKKNVFGGPLDRAFTALLAKTSQNLPLFAIEYRVNEMIYVCPSAAKIVVIFLVDFDDPTDKALAKVFLQEFVETQRTVRNAPSVSYSTKDPPGEISKLIGAKPDSAGFISFGVEERHVKGFYLLIYYCYYYYFNLFMQAIARKK
jgi:actin related protein 2/3 complex subunit 2